MSESDCDWAIPRFEGLDEVLAGHVWVMIDSIFILDVDNVKGEET